MILSYHYLR